MKAVISNVTALCQIRSDERVMLKIPAFESFYGGQLTLSTQLIKPNYLVILPSTKHHSSLETYLLYILKSILFWNKLLRNVDVSELFKQGFTEVMMGPIFFIIVLCVCLFQHRTFFSTRKRDEEAALTVTLLVITLVMMKTQHWEV